MSLKQYDEVCKGEFQEINAKLDDIAKRLYYDNGEECLQSKINRISNWVKYIIYFGGGIWTVVALPLIYKLTLAVYHATISP